MKQLKHWQDPLNGLLGVWMLLSPWALGFQGTTMAMANACIIGLALIATALGAIFVPRAWEEWTEAALGLWLVISPWALGFNTHYQATMNAVVSGMVILVLALWTLMTDKDYNGWLRHWTAH
ncbi:MULTISPECIES: SPW repeat protein [Polaromonas]|uniref:SPW repeat protein n=1 Tax=Polaromonas aquatica TaxID=332657 RepID=A0ABW1TXH6_9BURK